MDAILFLHHHPLYEAVMARHLALLKALNPNAEVVPLCFEPDRETRDWQWRNCDVLIYEWFIQVQPEHERFFIIEFDTFCTMPLKEFYGSAYDKPAVGSVIVLPWSHEPVLGYGQPMREWHWFSHGDTPRLYPFLRGLCPVCGAMFSRKCLAKMSSIYFSNREVDRLHAECRLGTLACMAGYEPERIREDSHLFILSKDLAPHQDRGIWHRVKT